MPAIRISFRNDDAPALAHQIIEALAARFPQIRLAAAPGEDVAGCGLLLVVIGPHWLGARQSHLADPLDPARADIRAAFQMGIPVIPVLVGDAPRPNQADLPADIRVLADLRTLELGAEPDLDLEALAHAVRATLKTDAKRAKPPSRASRGRGAGSAEADGFVDPDITLGLPPAGPLTGIPRMGRGSAPRVQATREEAPEPEPVGSAPPDALAPAGPAPGPVKLGASAPRAVRPGDEFTARFVAYAGAREAAVADMLNRLSPRHTSHLGLKTCQWRAGERFSVRLAGKGLEIDPEEESFVWDGEQALVEFDVAVPEVAALGVVVLKFDVFMDGISVARLRLDLEIAASADAAPAQVEGAAHHTAFASYSSKDRDRVLDRIDAVRIAAGLDIFLDCLSLHPGEQWKAALEREIPARDVFMLFWSAEAAKSPWVDWEWRRALAIKGLDAMQIHPLENGVKPPQELGALHFGSAAMYARRPAGG